MQEWRKDDYDWVLEQGKDLLDDLGQDAARKVIRENKNKIRANVHESVRDWIHGTDGLPSDEGQILQTLQPADIVTILSKGYASSVQLNNSQWAKQLATWHLVASIAYVDEPLRRKAVNEYIKEKMKDAAAPDPIGLELYSRFASTNRQGRTPRTATLSRSSREDRRKPKGDSGDARKVKKGRVEKSREKKRAWMKERIRD